MIEAMTASGREWQRVSRAAREIHTAGSPDEQLDVIVRSAVAAMPGIDHVGISRCTGDRRLDCVAASDELVRRFERLEDAHGGPCVAAALGDELVRAVPTRFEQRWPAYVSRALRLGLKAQISVRLHTPDEQDAAALNLYSTTTEEIDPEVDDLAELFASFAAMALRSSTSEGHLNSALATRRVIGQATGIVMVRYGLSDERAFGYLTRMSNTQNVKLRDLAEQIVLEANEKADGHDDQPAMT